MWVFTADGFFSAVEDRQDKDRLVVRARSKGDILRLAKVLGLDTAYHTPKADYPYRVRCNKEMWGDYLHRAALDIDYPNFKDRMAKLFDDRRMYQLHDVWAVMAGFFFKDQ